MPCESYAIRHVFLHALKGSTMGVLRYPKDDMDTPWPIRFENNYLPPKAIDVLATLVRRPRADEGGETRSPPFKNKP